MDTKEIAAKLDGATYSNFVRDDVQFEAVFEEAKQHGIVIVFGASDDLMEFRGAVDDELGAYNGTTAYLTPAGLLQNDCDAEDCPNFERAKKSAVTIDALWDAGDGYSWMFKTDIPHETFEITEDGDPYCRGVVFALADVPTGSQQ